MECDPWGDREWSTLMYTIRQNNCILMLGPDTSFEQINGQTQPLTEILAHELAEKIPLDIQDIDPSNLAQMAQYYLTETEEERTDLEAQVDFFYRARQRLTNQLYTDLAALPFYLTITTTPDHMFCEALRANNKKPIIESYNFRGENPNMVQMGTIKNPLVFYLYGTMDEPESVVLTEDDILDFLAAIIAKSPALPSNILSELRDKKKSLLFLGFGFKRWYLRILLHVLLGHDKKSRSFALEQCTPHNMEEFQKTILFFKMSNYKIIFCEKELSSFVQNLRERYEKEKHLADEERSAAKPTKKLSEAELQDAPTVFLCHSKQNRDDAEYLRDKLQEVGFNAWFDEDDLRGGDEWDRKIERAIKKEIDYFVVLQSNVMTTKLESYFNKEIRLALERQNYFRPGIRFIVPTKVEDCPLVEELEHLQTIDLSDKENVKDLISTLKKDQQRRNKK